MAAKLMVTPGTSCKATVVLLTFNGQRYLEETLAALRSQIAEFPYEVLAVDSGSTDGTAEALKEQPWVRLLEIPNDEFQHGRTRNMAASLGAGRLSRTLLKARRRPMTGGWRDSLATSTRTSKSSPRMGSTFRPELQSLCTVRHRTHLSLDQPRRRGGISPPCEGRDAGHVVPRRAQSTPFLF